MSQLWYKDGGRRMTNEEAVKMLEAKLECMRRDVSGIDDDCNRKLCDECHLCYDQGNMGEQQEYLRMSIESLKQEPCKDGWIPTSERLPKAGEYIGDGDVAKYYLVQNEYGDMMVARYTHSEYWEQIYQLKPIGDEIVAWRELPEPYVPDINVGNRK